LVIDEWFLRLIKETTTNASAEKGTASRSAGQSGAIYLPGGYPTRIAANVPSALARGH